MLRMFFTIITLGVMFGLDGNWMLHNEHEISLNKVIIKIDDNVAPKLGLQAPLSINDIDFRNFENLARGSVESDGAIGCKTLDENFSKTWMGIFNDDGFSGWLWDECLRRDWR